MSTIERPNEELLAALVIADGVSPESARTRLGIESTVSTVVCDGLCKAEDNISLALCIVGNDMERVSKAINDSISRGCMSICPACTNKHFAIAEALEYHAASLRS